MRSHAIKTGTAAVTGQQVADLVNPGRRLRPDHGNRGELAALLAPPLLERLGDSPVELLIRRPHGLGQVEVDLPQRRRLDDGRHGRLVAPVDQQAAPGGGMQLTHPREELRAGPAWHPLVSQDQRHVRTLNLKLLQPGQRLLRRRAGHDPVMRPVPAFQLPRQGLAASVLAPTTTTTGLAMTAILGHRDPAGHDRGGPPGQPEDHDLEALAVQQVVARASADALDRGILPRRAPARWRKTMAVMFNRHQPATGYTMHSRPWWKRI